MTISSALGLNKRVKRSLCFESVNDSDDLGNEDLNLIQPPVECDDTHDATDIIDIEMGTVSGVK